MYQNTRWLRLWLHMCVVREKSANSDFISSTRIPTDYSIRKVCQIRLHSQYQNTCWLESRLLILYQNTLRRWFPLQRHVSLKSLPTSTIHPVQEFLLTQTVASEKSVKSDYISSSRIPADSNYSARNISIPTTNPVPEYLLTPPVAS